MSNPIDELITKIKDHYDADVFICIGGMAQPLDTLFHLWLTKEKKEHKNAILLLRTLGGSADVAYKIARRFQSKYDTIPEKQNDPDKGCFYIFVGRECKSAGTLLSIGANTIIMSENAELGPLDVQLRKQDEVGERTSGLAPLQAMGSLRGQAIDHFKQIFLNLRFYDELSFSTKLAADVAMKITSGLLQPVYAQLDPIRIGEIERHLAIATAYGMRLAKSGNLNEGALGKILASYPSHGFVIDKEEAKTLFKKIECPIPELENIFDFFCSFTENNFAGKEKPFAMPVHTSEEQRKIQGEQQDGQATPEANRGDQGSQCEGNGSHSADGDQ